MSVTPARQAWLRAANRLRRAALRFAQASSPSIERADGELRRAAYQLSAAAARVTFGAKL